MKTLTAKDLVAEIAKLGMEKTYHYISGNNTIRLVSIEYPEGPIKFIRQNNRRELSKGSISRQSIARIALSCQSRPCYPLHIDRLFSGSGNTRSALETLLVLTPHFFTCNPERIDVYSNEIRSDLKHIMWCPEDSHSLGMIARKDYNGIINEQEASIQFGDIQVKASDLGDEFEGIEAKRTHTQMQVALVTIGNALNLRTWIARNDQHIVVGDRRLVDLPGVISSLNQVPVFFDDEIKQAATLIDCIWFTPDLREVPVIFEVEHSTGVTSGLTRMLKFRSKARSLMTVFSIVAPDALRGKVIGEVSQSIYVPLNARYMPYSNVRELFGLVQRYPLSGLVSHEFIHAFMEQIV